MKLEDYLIEENIFIADTFEDTDAFYAAFASFLKERRIVNDNEKVKRLFIKRENLQTTAIGKGFAAPHIFSDEFSEFIISVALIKKGLKYKSSPDDKNVTLVFLIMSNERDVGLHLKTLAHIARLVKTTDLENNLDNLNNKKQILEMIIKKESLL